MVVAQRKSHVEHFIVMGCCWAAGLRAGTSLDLGLDVEKDSSAPGSRPADGIVGAESSADGLDSTGDVSGLSVWFILAELGDGERDRPLALGLSGPFPAS